MRSEAQRSGGEKIIEKVPHVAVAVLSEVGAAAWADVSRGEKKVLSGRKTNKASLDNIKDVIYRTSQNHSSEQVPVHGALCMVR